MISISPNLMKNLFPFLKVYLNKIEFKIGSSSRSMSSINKDYPN